MLIPDPVGAGFVENLARPGGNLTGFAVFEYGFGTKYVELLKEIAPRVTRVAVLRDSATTSGTGQFAAIQAVAPSFDLEVIPLNVRDGGEIERAVTSFARSSNGGLIVTGSGLAAVNRELIVALAARYKLPAVYYQRFFVTDGGLISYGPNTIDPYRRAARRIAKTTSSSVRSGCFSIRPNRKSACFSNGEMLPPRGLAAQRPVCRKHLTQITAVLALTANSSAASRREAPLSTSAITRSRISPE
jgi:hypothetical protein